MALPRLERPFERGESGSKSYLDHEATTSISGGSSRVKDLIDILPEEYKFKVIDARPGLFDWGRISTEFKLSESFIERHKDLVDRYYIYKSQKLSEEFKKVLA